MKKILILFLMASFSVRAQWYFGTGEAVNLTNGTAYKNGVKTISGSLDPSATAVSAPAGSMYYSTSGTIYVKQDAGLSTSWLPLGVAAAGSLSTINGQSGPAISIATGSTGSDFNIVSGSNIITLHIPSSSASNRGLLSSTDWTAFNGKQDAITGAASTVVSSNLTANRAVISNGSGKISVSATTDTEIDYVSGVTSSIQTQLDSKEAGITATTSADYYRGDKTFQPLDKAAVGLSNVDNTSDATKNSASVTLTNKTLTAPVINSPTGIVKADVGLGNVDNTSDANKPVSTATQAALDAKVTGPASSMDAEIALFDSTTGKIIKRAAGTGYVKATSGVYSTSTTVAASDLTGTIPLANGGTNKSITPAAGAVVWTDVDSLEVSAAGTSGQFLVSGGTGVPVWSSVTPGSLQIATIKDVKASGTAGGTNTAGVHNTRTLNTLTDASSIVTSLTSNQFTLPAGSYYIVADAPVFSGNPSVIGHRIRIRNITDSTTAIMGGSERHVLNNVSTGATTRAFASGLIVIAAPKTFELQHFTDTSVTTNGFGYPTSNGESEVYAQVSIIKL